MNRTKLLKKLIKDMPLYFSYTSIKKKISLKTEIKDSTLQTYLSREVAENNIFDAGKGWYSTLEKEFRLDTEPVQKIIELIKQKFPFLNCSCWSTEQINPFTHHMLGKHIAFIYVDTDAINSVHEILLDNAYNSFANPNTTVVEKTFRISENTVVVRSEKTRQPACTGGASPIEKILIDIIVENRKLKIMQTDEINLVFENVLKSGRINFAILISYMKRRKLFSENTIKELHFLKKAEILDFTTLKRCL